MRKLWNYAPYPVWSLSTVDDKSKPNMNICSYVSPISMKPKEFMVAIYYNTKTLENIRLHKRGFLQLLSVNQTHLVRTLGKKSSLIVNKMKRVLEKEVIIPVGDYALLAESIGYIEIEFYELLETSADHVVGLARVVSSRNLNEIEPLNIGHLQGKGIIS
jgi:flavin reductase (DIM6/NTAB) family NADH-FMN oxidoreductase RutF